MLFRYRIIFCWIKIKLTAVIFGWRRFTNYFTIELLLFQSMVNVANILLDPQNENEWEASSDPVRHYSSQ